eukprot:3357670-Pyramimonas_sp.AAC.1
MGPRNVRGVHRNGELAACGPCERMMGDEVEEEDGGEKEGRVVYVPTEWPTAFPRDLKFFGIQLLTDIVACGAFESSDAEFVFDPGSPTLERDSTIMELLE